MVAHNGEEFLPSTLEALRRQVRPADFCVGVDTGSTDSSASLLQLGLPVGSPVVGAPPRAGFGAAVRTAVAEIPEHGGSAARNTQDPQETQEWLWLLHDDSAPEPDALQELLLAVERAPSVTVAGAKQVGWHDPRALVDVGLSISRWGERLTLIDVDEHDQGQYNSRSDVFAVNSAGMLVRRDAWDHLRGFDPAFHGVGDDVDLCWRQRLAGNRVVVVPSAGIRHAVARPHPISAPRDARAAEVYLRLKHSAPWGVPFLAVGAVLGGVARFLLGLLAKDPAHGTGQLLGSLKAVAHPVALYHSRRSAARTRTLPRSIVRPLQTQHREVWLHRRSVIDAFTSRGAGGQEQRGPTEEYIPSGTGDPDTDVLPTPSRSWVGAGAVAATLLLLAAALAGLGRLVGAPALTGGALLPVAAAPSTIWAGATSWWTGLGAGYAAHGSPFGYLLWLLSLAGLGSANAAVVTLVVCALPLAGLSAWFAAGALTRSRSLRLWAALSWGAAPALQVALGGGRLGALIAHVLLPLALLGVVRAVGAALGPCTAPETLVKPGINGTRSWTAAAAAGLLLALLGAAAPSLLPFTVAALLAAVLLGGRRARTLWWALLPVAALHLPYAVSAASNPRGFFGDPGVPTLFTPASSWQQLLGFPVAFDPLLPPAGVEALGAGPWALAAALLIGGPVVLLAAVALFLPAGRRPLARLLWLPALLALVLATVAGNVPVAVGPTSFITVHPGPLVSAAVLCLLAAALSAFPGRSSPAASEPVRRAGSMGGVRRRALRPAGAVLLAAGPLLSLVLWIAPSVSASTPDGPSTVAATGAASAPTTTDFGTRRMIQPSAERPLPATAADRGTGPERTRTLVLTVDDDGNATAALMRGSGTTLDALNPLFAARVLEGGGSVLVREDTGSSRVLRTTAAVLLGGTGADPRADLRDLGVGFVVLQQPETAGELLAGRISAVPGLTSVGATDAGLLWRVVPGVLGDGTEDEGAATARVRVVGADGRTAAVVPSGLQDAGGAVPAGDGGRTLVLAEESDPGWQATLDGVALAPTSSGWYQEFALPAHGGTVRVRYVSPYQPWVGTAQLVVLGMTVLLAVPLPTRPRLARPKSARTRQPGSPGPAPADPGTGPSATGSARPVGARRPVTVGGGRG